MMTTASSDPTRGRLRATNSHVIVIMRKTSITRKPRVPELTTFQPMRSSSIHSDPYPVPVVIWDR